MAMISAPGEGTVDDASLARAAREGDGRAFAALYDRHERRVYGFCLRMLGRPEDAADATQETFVRVLMRLGALEAGELNFIAYVLGASRNVCYDMLGRRNKVELVGDHERLQVRGLGAIEDDPERQAMLDASRELVAAAHDALPERQREVLALRELESLSYDDIGALMGMKSNAVAQLISRARINLRNGVRGAALASVGGEGPDCDRALPLLAVIQDDQAAEIEDLAWLQAHLADCPNCRARREAMDEAGVSYRLLVPIIPLLWLRHAAIARAADAVGADWREVADRNPELDDQSVFWNRMSRHRVAITGGIVLCAVIMLIFGVTVTSDREAHFPHTSAPTLAGVASTGIGVSTTNPTHRHGHHSAAATPAESQIATAVANVLTTASPQGGTLVAGTGPGQSVPPTPTATTAQTTAGLGSRDGSVNTTTGAAGVPVTDTSAAAKTATMPVTTTTVATTPTETGTATVSAPTQTVTQPTTTQPATATSTTPTTTCTTIGVRCK